jgi:hypothetical protein
MSLRWLVVVVVVTAASPRHHIAATSSPSRLGDPGMRAATPAVAMCAWSFCNGAAQPQEYRALPTRMADCNPFVTDDDNALIPGDPIPGFATPSDANTYAQVVEQYLGQLCSKPGPLAGGNWSHWSVMFKSGNLDLQQVYSLFYLFFPPLLLSFPPSLCVSLSHFRCCLLAQGLCNSTALPASTPPPSTRFNNLAMNQPLVAHSASSADWPLPYTKALGTSGFFAATYDVPASVDDKTLVLLNSALHNYTTDLYDYRLSELAGAPGPVPRPPAPLINASFSSVQWYWNVTSSAWVFFSTIVTTVRTACSASSAALSTC